MTILPSSEELTPFFNTLCDHAALETLPRFRSRLDVTNKLDHDFDPVTEGDKAAERAIRALIMKTYPSHGIIGEEYGAHNPQSEFQWIIDPIDGTRAFISGLPLWGTLIGLYHNGIPLAGAMDQPFTNERYLSLNGPSHLYQKGNAHIALSTSITTELSQATLMTTSPHILHSPQDQGYFKVEEQVKLFRYGADCYAYCLLAGGHIDLVIESGLNIYDIAALIPIIENAGGVITDWQGNSAAQGGQVLASANETLHNKALALL